MSECRHASVFSFDSMPPMRVCTDCNKTLPLTEQDKADYKDYTGEDWVDPPNPFGR